MLIDLKDVQKIAATLPQDQLNPDGGNKCVYTDPADPTSHCIAGEILFQLGVPLPDVDSAMNANTIDGWVGEGFVDGFELSRDALSALSSAQCKADGGARWGNALRRAGLL